MKSNWLTSKSPILLFIWTLPSHSAWLPATDAVLLFLHFFTSLHTLCILFDSCLMFSATAALLHSLQHTSHTKRFSVFAYRQHGCSYLCSVPYHNNMCSISLHAITESLNIWQGNIKQIVLAFDGLVQFVFTCVWGGSVGQLSSWGCLRSTFSLPASFPLSVYYRESQWFMTETNLKMSIHHFNTPCRKLADQRQKELLMVCWPTT